MTPCTLLPRGKLGTRTHKICSNKNVYPSQDSFCIFLLFFICLIFVVERYLHHTMKSGMKLENQKMSEWSNKKLLKLIFHPMCTAVQITKDLFQRKQFINPLHPSITHLILGHGIFYFIQIAALCKNVG